MKLKSHVKVSESTAVFIEEKNVGTSVLLFLVPDRLKK